MINELGNLPRTAKEKNEGFKDLSERDGHLIAYFTLILTYMHKVRVLYHVNSKSAMLVSKYALILVTVDNPDFKFS